MKIWKILIAAVVVTVFEVVVGGLTCGWLFKWVYEIEPTNVWKPMEAPPVTFYVGALVLNILFVLVYALLAKGIPGKNKLLKVFCMAYAFGWWEFCQACSQLICL